MSFLAAAGDMYSCSSVCNLISFRALGSGAMSSLGSASV